MDLAKAKEVERLKRNTLMNERVKEADSRRKQINATPFMNPSLKGDALVESTLTQVEAGLEDALHIRKELLLRSADLRSEYERKKLEEELHRTIAAQVNQIKQSFANLGIRVSCHPLLVGLRPPGSGAIVERDADDEMPSTVPRSTSRKFDPQVFRDPWQ